MELLKFGDYVVIEMKRHGVENERYTHKVIGQLGSNAYVDVPVQDPVKETIHDKVVPVVACICCGVDETKVFRFRVEDVNLSKPLLGLEKPEPYKIDWPEYHDSGMGCGLEDRNITDRYEAMRHGWDCALDAVGESLPENLYTSPQKRNPLSEDAILKIINDFDETANLNFWEKEAILVGITLAEKAHGIGS